MKSTFLVLFAFAVFLTHGAYAKDLAVKFEGTPTANDLSVAAQDAIDELVEDGLDFDQGSFACFEAPLFDLSTGRRIGTGVDCLAPVPVDLSDSQNLLDTGVPAALAFGLRIEAFTFFLLPGGNLANHGMTSVQPFYPMVGNALGAVTHMSGSIPSDFLPGGIEGATGRFSGWIGTVVRLSGAVNLSLPNDQIFFSCIFIIEQP